MKNRNQELSDKIYIVYYFQMFVHLIANIRVDIRLVVVLIQSNDFNDFIVDQWHKLHHHIIIITIVLLFRRSMSITSKNQHRTSWSCAGAQRQYQTMLLYVHCGLANGAC